MPRKRHGDQDLICRRCLVACSYERHYYNAETKPRNGRKPNDHLPEPVARTEWDDMVRDASLAAAQVIRHLRESKETGS